VRLLTAQHQGWCTLLPPSPRQGALARLCFWGGLAGHEAQFPKTQLKISGATMVASLSMMYLGVDAASLPQVIFSLGTAPE